uniref:Uncharacterized protein n=1 Tax=Avena sativa TaxID=4498 RepID=A0ACD5VB61_AVESA
MASKELSIKLVINKKTGKLCFAEASGDVVEFLTGLLSLPLGTIASLLAKEKEGMVGSVGTLLGSAETLGASYNIKELQLSPAVTPDTLSRLQQLLGVQLNGNGKFFACSGKGGGTNCVHLSPINYSVCPGCKCYRQKAMTLAGAESGVVAASAMKPPTPKYTLKDDLSLTPESLSVISLLAECGVKDLSVLQEKIVNIGKEEVQNALINWCVW